MITLAAGQVVACAEEYVVVDGGTYEPDELVGCARLVDGSSVVTAAFLAAMVERFEA